MIATQMPVRAPEPAMKPSSSKLEAAKLDAPSHLDELAQRFDIDPVNGFMPSEEPVRRLTGLGECWEEAWDSSTQLALHTASKEALAWRRKVEEMPIRRDLSFLSTIRLQRRARCVLVYLAHRYVQCIPVVDEAPAICDSVGVPLLQLCALLDMPPVITYADSATYNWRFIDPAKGYKIENLECNLLVTNTRSEAHFMLIPMFIEIAGAPALKLFPLMIEEINSPSPSFERIASQLHQLARIIDDCTKVLMKMSPTCVVDIFYYKQRPWFMGGPRLIDGKILDFGGASAGQSTLIHAFDVFLSVDHTPSTGDFEATFMKRMSAYMPAPHRAYLVELARISPVVRAFALEHPQSIVGNAYNDCVDSLRKLREGHMKIVFDYIIVPARKDAKAKGEEAAMVGTGGSDLQVFLKLTRQRTMAARVE